MGTTAKKYSEEKIIQIVKEMNDGASLASIARTHGVNVQTLYRWRDKYAGMTGTELSEREAHLLDYESVSFRSGTHLGVHETKELRSMFRRQSGALLAEKPNPTALAEMIKGLHFLGNERPAQRQAYIQISDALIQFGVDSQMKEEDKAWLKSFRSGLIQPKGDRDE